MLLLHKLNSPGPAGLWTALATMLLVSGLATDTYAQITYGQPVVSHPVVVESSPHYATSQPVGIVQGTPSSIQYPHATTALSVVHQSVPVASSSLAQPSTTFIAPSHKTPVLSSTRTVSEPLIAETSTRQRDHEVPARLASTRRLATTFNQPHYNSIPRFDETTNSGQRYLPPPPSPYRTELIEGARQTAHRFREIAQNASDLGSKLANENAALADQWAELALSHLDLSARLSQSADKLQAATADFNDVNAKLDRYGLTTTIGLLLRGKKDEIDAWQVEDSHTLFAGHALENSRHQQLELEMWALDGSDAKAQTIQLLADYGYQPGNSLYRELAAEVRGLLEARHEWITALHVGYRDYQEKLGELDATARGSVALARDYRKLINQQITWIASDDPISFRDLYDLKSGGSALFDARRSADFGPTINEKLDSNSARGIGLLIATLLVFVARWRLKSWLVGIGNRTRMRGSTDESRKAASALLTVLVALAIPAVLYAIAKWLSSGVVSESTLHAAEGFFAASLVALAIEIPRQLLRDQGFVHKFVDVEMLTRQTAFRSLTLLGFVLVVAAYTITVMSSIDHGAWRASVGRVGFMLTMLMVAWSTHRFLRPKGGHLEPLIEKFGGSVIHRVRGLIYFVGIGFPIAMLILSACGYGFTAGELIKRVLITITGGLIALTAWSAIKIFAARGWQFLTGATPPPRKFDEYGEIETQGSSVNGLLAEHSLELKHQLAFLCQCALVMTAIACVGWLWQDMFPNFQVGNPVVWTVQDTVTESTVDAAGQTVSRTFVQSTPITVFHLLLAAGTLFIAFQLAKLLPALFDALVLQRVSFDEGMEHFTLVLGRCLLFGVGCFIACRWIGIRWQAIQWLAVGLTIGLGFGLQDIVKNVFGGLVVLFEKPARLGDLITVGDVTGRVSHQRLRTTVVSDNEGREVVIPNKNFVSEDVTNWMGAGRLNVVPIEVALTRDERPADICRSLQELVVDQPDVLLSPAPQATLVCVGKSTQRIELRAWIEQSHDVLAFRDSLLATVTSYLKERRLLASAQPSQPVLKDWTSGAKADPLDDLDDSTLDDILGESRRPRRRSNRKRSA